MYKEEEVEKLAENFIKKISEKIKSEIVDAIYNELSGWLYEHYENASDRVKDDLINKIVDDFKREPKNYKFKKVRQKLFEENREVLDQLLIEDQIQKSIEKIVWDHTHIEHGFKWKWEEAIGKFIANHLDDYIDNENVKKVFAKELREQENIIKCLKNQIRELEELKIYYK